jgi:hypothetical protein
MPISEIPVHAEPRLITQNGQSGLAIVGRFKPWPWNAIPQEAKMADALESAGVKVFRVDQYASERPVMEAQWALFTTDRLSWGRLPQWIRTHKTALWTFDWILDHPEKRPVIDAVRKMDLLVTADKFEWSKLGIKNHFYLPACCDSDEPAFQPNPKRPCAFIGPLDSLRRLEIARIVRFLGGEVRDAHDRGLQGKNFAEYVQRTKVMVEEGDRNDVLGHWPVGNYKIPGAGGFLLTARSPGLESDFELEDQVATYGSLKELEKTIKKHIAEDSAREKTRRKGFKHVRRYHTWAVRAMSLLARMGLFLRTKG